MKKLILLAIVLSFISVSAFAENVQDSARQARIQKLQTVIQYLTNQRKTYLDNAKQTLRTFDAQIQDAQEQLRALTPKPKVNKNEKKATDKKKINIP